MSNQKIPKYEAAVSKVLLALIEAIHQISSDEKI